jgi:hypothetical protein
VSAYRVGPLLGKAANDDCHQWLLSKNDVGFWWQLILRNDDLDRIAMPTHSFEVVTCLKMSAAPFLVKFQDKDTTETSKRNV